MRSSPAWPQPHYRVSMLLNIKNLGKGSPTPEATMQMEPYKDRPDELGTVLKGWRVEASLPPRFREGVWRRIAIAHENRMDWRRFWRSLFLRCETLVRKPVGVAACLALCTAAGLGIGAWHAQAFTLRAENAWQEAYLHSVSPTMVALNR